MSGERLSSSPAGQIIAGRYELLELIGRGGHGMVCRALDRETKQPVAVKMLTDVAARDPALVERLRREQLALTRLAGTSAVRVFDLCASPSGMLCMVMELLDGMDLDQRLEAIEKSGARMLPRELIEVLAPIVDTLERAHQSEIVHRDLKPANIFLLSASAGGGVRLLDFGLARIRRESPLTAAGTIVGSPSYIAPEVWKGRPDLLDHRVDVYSFGVIVFRALAGSVPFPGESLRDKFIAATSAERPSLIARRPELSSDLDSWVQQVLAIEPDDRFSSIRAAFNGLLAALDPPGAESSPASGKRARVSDAVAGVWQSAREVVGRLMGARSEPRAAADETERDPKPVAPVEPAPSTPGALGPERSLVSEWLTNSNYDLSAVPITPQRVVAVGTSGPVPSSELDPPAPLAQGPAALGGVPAGAGAELSLVSSMLQASVLEPISHDSPSSAGSTASASKKKKRKKKRAGAKASGTKLSKPDKAGSRKKKTATKSAKSPAIKPRKAKAKTSKAAATSGKRSKPKAAAKNRSSANQPSKAPSSSAVAGRKKSKRRPTRD